MTIIAACFAVEILLAKPALGEIVSGLVPRLKDESLYVAIGILGATVMPHNLYLHSALVQTRRIGTSEAEKRAACKFNLIDSVVALNGALFVNAAILILAAAVFFKRGLVVTEIQQAHLLLAPLLGTTFAGALFAIALLCAGQSSTLTGTMAGQIVMEGFLNFRMRAWLRRLITRTLAVVPAALTILSTGEKGAYKLLILSQVILSMQLPFAVIPLIQFTNNRMRMGKFTNAKWIQGLAWITAAIIVALNIKLVITVLSEWVQSAGAYRGLILMLVVPAVIAIFLLLLWVAFEPLLPAVLRKGGRTASALPRDVAVNLETPAYKRILVPLDHTDRDRPAIAHAAALARTHGAKLYLLHVEEGVTSQVYGQEASTAEVEAGREYLDGIVEALRSQGVKAESIIRHSTTPRAEIVRLARDIKPDLLVMGAHGHTGIKDLIFGATINSVRHELEAPILVVRDRR